MKIIQYLHKNITIWTPSKSIKTEKGVVQGMISSPQLFNITLAPSISTLEKMNHICTAYADDLIGICENEEKLKSFIVIFEECMEISGLEINKSKTKVIQFTGRKAMRNDNNNQQFLGY